MDENSFPENKQMKNSVLINEKALCSRSVLRSRGGGHIFTLEPVWRLRGSTLTILEVKKSFFFPSCFEIVKKMLIAYTLHCLKLTLSFMVSRNPNICSKMFCMGFLLYGKETLYKSVLQSLFLAKLLFIQRNFMPLLWFTPVLD